MERSGKPVRLILWLCAGLGPAAKWWCPILWHKYRAKSIPSLTEAKGSQGQGW